MRLILIIILIFYIQPGFGQTISLPDTNFRNKLIKSYPTVMQGSELVISKAAALTGALDLRYSDITDAEGIQYFTKITTLDLSHNLLTSLPSISATTGLQHFYATGNNLTSLPDLSALTQLRDFQVMQNELTALPELPESLLLLYCSDNKISKIPPLNNFPDLTNLVIGKNPLEQPIDFSSCTNLVQLHIHKTGADTIIGLEKLDKLTTLFAWGNAITDFSGLDSNTTLSRFIVFDNMMSELPFLLNKPRLAEIDINNCQLTFEDINTLLRLNITSNIIYTPQKKIFINDFFANEGSSVTLSYPYEQPDPANIYVWIKNGNVTDSSYSSVYNINSVKKADSGEYVLKIYNQNVPDLQLETYPFRLKLKACVEFSITSPQVVEKECGKGYTLDFSNAVINGGIPPFEYVLESEKMKEKYTVEIIKNLSPGKYNISVTDSRNCSATKEFILNQIEKCDPVITPNGDGIADNYFIEKTGKVHIYDLKRRLINTLDAPGVWDGTDQNGVVLDTGYYILTMESETPVFISIIR